MPKIKLWVDTGFAGASHKDYFYVDDQEWAEMSDKEKEDLLEEAAEEFLHNKIEYGARVVDEE